MNPIYRHSFADVFLKTGIINANTGALITSGDAVQNRYYSTYVSVSNVYPRVLLINTGVDRGAFYDSNKKLTETKCEMLENVGMKKEAVLRNRKINEKTGKSENLIVYSIMKNEKTYQ